MHGTYACMRGVLGCACAGGRRCVRAACVDTMLVPSVPCAAGMVL
jgi:hypothetical protein